jgi:carbon-monoxide dehydrogenase medium subunit
VRLDSGRVADPRVAVGSAGVRAARAPAAEEALSGTDVGEIGSVEGEVGALAAEAADAVEDANGSVEYKRHLVGVLTKRALGDAVAQAGGNGAVTGRASA